MSVVGLNRCTFKNAVLVTMPLAATVKNEDARLFFSKNSATVGKTYTARLMIQSCIGIL